MEFLGFAKTSAGAADFFLAGSLPSWLIGDQRCKKGKGPEGRLKSLYLLFFYKNIWLIINLMLNFHQF